MNQQFCTDKTVDSRPTSEVLGDGPAGLGSVLQGAQSLFDCPHVISVSHGHPGYIAAQFHHLTAIQKNSHRSCLLHCAASLHLSSTAVHL